MWTQIPSKGIAADLLYVFVIEYVSLAIAEGKG